jgi:hypothetical protein
MPGPHKLSEGLLDKEIALAITEDRRIEGRTKLRATPKLVTMLVWSVLMSIGAFSGTASAQNNGCKCKTVLFTDCDGTPGVFPLTVEGGDLAGTINNLGQVKGDGRVDQFDVVRLIELYYKGQYDVCADLDGSQTLNLEPVIIGGVEYCGDLVLMRRIFGPCQASCRDPQGNNPCNVVSTEPGCTDSNCCALVCSIDDVCCEAAGWDAACVNTALQVCTSFGGDGGGSCLIPDTTPNCLSVPCTIAVCANNPLCCSIAWDQSCVDLAGLLCIDFLCEEENLNNPANCSLLPCGEPDLGSCSIPHLGAGCSDPACCALVCQADPSCCFDTWDVACARAASETCASVTAYCGNISNNDNCFTPGVSLNVLQPASGCQDFECCSEVCQFDPFCCLITWDQTCADNAKGACARYPNCGANGTIDCLELPDPDNPADIQQGCSSINCCNTVCELDPLCCNLQWDTSCWLLASQLCTNCGSPNAGSCFDTENNSPGCNNELCCQEICALIDPFCCDEDLGSWDQQCVAQAELYCLAPSATCGNPKTRNCFLTSDNGGCNDTNCCTEICENIDTYCCEISWDAICATTALSVQSCLAINNYQQLGSCLEAHGGKGCNVPACAAAVCALPGQLYSDCCEIQWDQNCADKAALLCYDLLVCPTDAPCDEAHLGIGCEDPFCCSYVCEIDPTCCSEGWDDECVSQAQNCSVDNPGFNFPGPDEGFVDPRCPCSGSCFEARLPGAGKPGCQDASCCSVVCSIDPSCCAEFVESTGEPGNWGPNCVALAEQYCCGGETCGDYCAGGCLSPSDSPYCDDPACCTAVCAIDSYCCDTRWDSNCAILAAERCTSGCGIPTSGSCFISKLGTGCDNPECCAEICDQDPFCCLSSWDTACADLATQLPSVCVPPVCGDFGSGACCEINGSPACNDAGCCQAVCAEDPFCCEGGWDEQCVFLARTSPGCTTVNGCVTGPASCEACAGSCCVANGTPGCDSEPCCTAVCQLDSFCCDNEWDVYCAEQARLTCSYNGEANGNPDVNLDACPAPKCGTLGSGSCCIPNGTPLCDDKECCEAVGAVDPYCTTVSWDENCVALAVNTGSCDCQGGVACGDPAAGDCCTASDTPFCNDNACCTTVCNIDPTCCTIFWSEDCLIWADFYCTELCGGGGAPAPVFEPPLPSTAFPSTKVKSSVKKVKPIGVLQPSGPKSFGSKPSKN